MSIPEASKVCSQCGASNPAEGAQCWLCQAELRVPDQPSQAIPVAGEPTGEENPFAPPQELPVQQSGDIWIAVGWGLLLVAISAVCAGIHLALGAVVLVLGLPALVATHVIANRRRVEGRPLTLGKKVQVFIGSMFVTFLVLVAAAVGLVIVCFAVVFSDTPVFR